MSSSTDDQFDWDRDESVVLRRRMAIAIFFNDNGDLVIRQEAWSGHEEEMFVVIPLMDVRRVARRLTDLAAAADGVASRDAMDVMFDQAGMLIDEPERGPKDRTAADRQRRRRAKLRDGHASVTALNRDSDRDTIKFPDPMGIAAE